MELHGFACVIYLRVLYTDASVSVSLVYSKTKIAPLKVISTSMSELCGVILLVKTLEYVSVGPIRLLYLDGSTLLLIIFIHLSPTGFHEQMNLYVLIGGDSFLLAITLLM